MSGLVVVIEDNPRLRRLYRGVLRRQGSSALTFGSGEQALKVLANTRPRVLVIDIVLVIDMLMSDIDGVEVCRRARLLIGPDTPILFMTALDRMEVLHTALQVGGDDFIIKSESPRLFASRVGFWQRATNRANCEERREAALREVENALRRAAGAPVEQQELSSRTDPVLADMSHFLQNAVGAASGAFGRAPDQRAFFLGFACGVADFWAELHFEIAKRVDDYVLALLGEADLYDARAAQSMVGARANLANTGTFERAYREGKRECWLARDIGPSYIPLALRAFEDGYVRGDDDGWGGAMAAGAA